MRVRMHSSETNCKQTPAAIRYEPLNRCDLVRDNSSLSSMPQQQLAKPASRGRIASGKSAFHSESNQCFHVLSAANSAFGRLSLDLES